MSTRTARTLRRMAAGVALVALIAAAAAASRRWGGTADADAPVSIARVGRRTIATYVKATGVVRPMTGAQVRVGSRISGIVRRLYVRVGDRVRAGQLLAEIDDRELLARHREASASQTRAKADLEFASADLERKRELAGENLLPRSDLDTSERAFAVASEQVAEAQATLDYASTQLTYARIDAPISGVVASVSTQEGETVAASFATPTFVTLLDLARLEVWAYVDETDIGRIRPGQPASFTVDTYGDRAFDGRVSEIYPQAEIRDNVVNYVTVVRFQPPQDRQLRPEMTTSVRIGIEEKRGVLGVPLRAVQRDAGRPFVWRQRNDRFERTPVTLGSRDDAAWEVVTGLQEGDRVALGTPGAPAEGDR